MENQYGLQRSLGEKLVRPFWEYRGNENKPGVPITFGKFMRTRPDGGPILKNAAGQPFTWADLYVEMGVSPYSLYLNNLATRDDDYQLLFGPILEDPFIKGFTEMADGVPAIWRALCAQTGVPSASEAVKKTSLKFNATPKPTAELEDFPEATITHAEETIAWKKKGVSLKLSVEYLRVNPVAVASVYVTEVGLIYQHLENQACVATGVNGDLASGANAAPVIGVLNTTDGLTYKDEVQVWVRGSAIGERWFTMVCGEAMANVVLNIEEFKKREQGTAQVQVVNRPEPSSMPIYVSSEVPANQVTHWDVGHAMRQRVFIPINVKQSERPENWSEGIVIGYSTAFERIADKAIVAVDGSIVFGTAGFPAWFVVGGSRP